MSNHFYWSNAFIVAFEARIVAFPTRTLGDSLKNTTTARKRSRNGLRSYKASKANGTSFKIEIITVQFFSSEIAAGCRRFDIVCWYYRQLTLSAPNLSNRSINSTLGCLADVFVARQLLQPPVNWHLQLCHGTLVQQGMVRLDRAAQDAISTEWVKGELTWISPT